MAGFSSRDLTVDWDSTTLAGVQSKDLAIARTPIDVTTDDDAGFRTFLPKAGAMSADLSISGISSDEVLVAAITSALAADETAVVNFPSNLASPGDITGTFHFTSFNVTGSSPDGAVEFSATLQSSGAFTYTASSA